MLMLLKTVIAIDMLMAIGLVVFRYALAPRYRSIVSGKLVAFALITPAVALFCGNFYIFCAYLVAIVAFNSRSRAELASVFVFLLPLCPGLSQETAINGVYLFAISSIVAMSTGALIGFLLTPGRKMYAQTRFDVGLILIIFMFIYIYTREPTVTTIIRSLTANLFGFVGPYLLVSRGMTSREDINRLLLRLSMGATLTAVVAIFQARKQWLLSQAYYEALHVTIPFGTQTLAMRAGFLRTGGLMDDYSAAGLFFAAIIALMILIKPCFTRVGFWAVLAVLIGGLMTTQSRGAWLAAAVGVLIIFIYRKQWVMVALFAAGGAAAEAAALVLGKAGVVASIMGTNEETAGTVSYRKQLAERGIDQIKAHPIFGQDPNHLVNNMKELTQGQHIVDFVNAHLFIAMTAGVPLFIIWCYFWLAPVFEAWLHPARHDAQARNLVAVPVAIIVPVMVALVATSIIDRNLTWPAIAVALAGPCFVLARQSRSSRSTRKVSRVAAVAAVPYSRGTKIFTM